MLLPLKTSIWVGLVHLVDATSTDVILSIKERLTLFTGIDPSLMQLKLPHVQMWLSDTSSLEAMGIKADSILYLVISQPPQVPIFATAPSAPLATTTINSSIKRDDSVSSIEDVDEILNFAFASIKVRMICAEVLFDFPLIF